MSSAPTRPIEIPPFQLQPLISDVPPPSNTSAVIRHRSTGSGDFFGTGVSPLDLFSRVTNAAPRPSGPSRDAQQASSTQREIVCAQALNKDIFVGCSDGTLMRYTAKEEDNYSGDPYHIVSQQVVPGGKPIDRIVLVPFLCKALVLSGGTLHFYTLPSLDALPPAQISPLRGVLTFSLDENALRVHPNYPTTSIDEKGVNAIRLAIIRRRSIVVFALGDRLRQLGQEIPLPSAANRIRMTGKTVIIADSTGYSLVELESPSMIELMDWTQVPLEQGSPVRSSITVSDENEFMLTIWTGAGTLGMFMTSSAEPTRGTVEYPQHPTSLSVDYPYIVALLPNNTLEIHSMEGLSIVAVLSCPTTLQASLLSFNIGGYLIPSTRNQAVQLVTTPLIPPPPSPTKPKSPPISPRTSSDHAPPSGSGLTPPPTPAKPRRSVGTSQSATTTAFTRSKTLIIGPRGVYALLPSTLVSQIDSLLESSRLEDAVQLADQALKKMEMPGAIPDLDQAQELRLIYQRIAFKYLAATMFEDAGKSFLKGRADPRLLVRMFPDLRGNLINWKTEEAEVFAGIQEDVKKLTDVDQIIMANLVRNYHPHIKPSVEEATPTAELRRVLNVTARDMLCNFLVKTRQERRKAPGIGGSSDDAKLNRIIDTVLAKLHIESENVSQLRFLVDSSEDLAVQELEPLLISHGLFNVLAAIYEKKKEEGRLLDLWTKIVDGEWKDLSFNQNALQRIIETLMECKDRVTVQRYGIWLAKHDAPAAMKLFISKRGMKLDDNLLLRAMRAVDIDVGEQYLEHLVLGRKNSEPALHEQLIQHYLDRLFTSLHDPETITFWQEAASSYSSATRDAFSQPPSFLEHVASLSNMPHARLRIKMALFLQGSTGYNVFTVRDRVQKSDEHELLGFERAILDGKIGNHKAALTLLVRTVHDSTSAEAYCTSGGEVVSNRVATVVGRQLGLDLWSNLVVSGGVSGLALLKNKVGKMERNVGMKEAVDESKKKELLKILMEVHMARGDGAVHETARLLNSQAMNLDAYDVLSAVPPTWSLAVISSFLSRSFRRSLHDLHEGQILKAISSGQNLEVLDEAYTVLHEQGAIIEEAGEGDFDDRDQDYDSEKPIIQAVEGEDYALREKVGLHEEEGDEGGITLTGGNDTGVKIIKTPQPQPAIPTSDWNTGGFVHGSVDSSRTIT